MIAGDYIWIQQEEHFSIGEGYCLALVRGLTPTECLDRIGATPEGVAPNTWNLAQLCNDAWDRYGGDRMVIGATAVPGGWTLTLEANGYLTVTEKILIPLSAGTRVVSHFRNCNAVDRFHWAEDGDIRVSFEPLFPTARAGSTPDALVEQMREAGFDLRENGGYELHTEAAFALAERLTGVRLTPELFGSRSFTWGTAAVP
ncbi:DUF6461 domain-containing protein [Rhizohabitans arisaemae]|uniref:DUF6461 domain-containing protein n=1 Tax=Rhizohabitans arisaemae TaxID=2720610 RepID=UPI0024B1C9FA|nr:DUF6461 domain-containing protein [Rhizohabitans arisaemae]